MWGASKPRPPVAEPEACGLDPALTDEGCGRVSLIRSTQSADIAIDRDGRQVPAPFQCWIFWT